MTSIKRSRRNFVKASATAAALAALPTVTSAASTLRIRLEWQQFKTTPQYASFLNAVRTMKAVTDATKKTSWQYWVNVHVNYCPHGIPYFLAWHRGYIYYLEQQLQTVSGDTSLTLPYWDYYTNPNIPTEFTDAATNNPLYVQRTGTNVYAALDLAPFAANVHNFQRGTTNAFETQIESAPHNPVHDLIGGYMGDMTSPTDPIFFLHHANIDRLWHAWSLPDGNGMPVPPNKYWNGSFTYAKGLTMVRSNTYDPWTLGYDYANTSRPTALPAQAQIARIIRVQAQLGPIMIRPALASFGASAAKSIAANRRSLGGLSNVDFGEKSFSVQLPLKPADTTQLRGMVAATPANITATDSADAATAAQQTITIVLDGIVISDLGKKGGYFYNVYLNLPATGDVDSVRHDHFLGTLGAFQIAGAAHHGIPISYPANEVLAKLGPTSLNDLVVSLVRVNGNGSPKGNVIRVTEIRVETGVPMDMNMDMSGQ